MNFVSPVHTKVIFTLVYLVCNRIVSKKISKHTLIEDTLLLKNAKHHLSLQRAVIFWLVEGLASGLVAAD